MSLAVPKTVIARLIYLNLYPAFRGGKRVGNNEYTKDNMCSPGAVMTKIFSFLKKELGEVEKRIRRELTAGGRDRKPVFTHAVPYLDWQIRPALVTGVARLYNCYCERVITLAVVVQLIYLAGALHLCVADEGRFPNRDPDRIQWPVILGDYLYSRFFALMCEANMTEFIAPLAETISISNEAGIQRQQYEKVTPDRLPVLVERETARLFATACRLAGQVAGASPDDLTRLDQFGLNFGMGYGLHKYELSNLAERYFAAAADTLAFLPAGTARSMLLGLTKVFTPQCESRAVTGVEG